MTTNHIEVFFIGPKNGWATAEHDSEGNQIGYAVYNYRKTWAVKEARAMSGGIFPVRVFGANGKLQKEL